MKEVRIQRVEYTQEQIEEQRQKMLKMMKDAQSKMFCLGENLKRAELDEIIEMSDTIHGTFDVIDNAYDEFCNLESMIYGCPVRY